MVEHKADRRVSLVLPARDEAATIGRIVAVVREALVDRTGLVDELLVVDSRSQTPPPRSLRPPARPWSGRTR